MAAKTQAQKHEEMKTKVLYVAAKLFLEKGYTETSLKEISSEAKINIGSLVNLFKNKENILCELVGYVFEGQFKATEVFLGNKTDDKILFYAAETTLQLHMAESHEYIRDLYVAAYSMPNTMALIQQKITGKLEEIFEEQLPNLETKDFFELEIASGGIMRSFMATPCDMYFTMERKVRRFIETTLRLYRVSDEKINETIDFVMQFDFEPIAEQVIEGMLKYLEKKTL